MIEERQGYNSYKKSTSRTRCRLRNYSVRNTHVEHKTNIQTYTTKDKIPKNLFNFDYFVLKNNRELGLLLKFTMFYCFCTIFRALNVLLEAIKGDLGPGLLHITKNVYIVGQMKGF